MSEPKTLKLKVVGEHTIHCSGCERTVQFILSQLPGVREVKANHKTQDIEIRMVGDETDLEKVRAELDWIGYQVSSQ